MKEKWVRINTIEGYEEVKDCYWISNSNEDKIMNRDTGKILKIGINKDGYPIVSLMTIDGKARTYNIHVMKAKAFIYTPNPLGYNVVRHLNDIKTDNSLTNLAWGTRSDNAQDSIRNGRFNYEAVAKNGARTGAKNGKINGKINGAKNGKKSSKPVRCIETGMIFESIIGASRQTGIPYTSINLCCNGKRQTAGKYHWEFVNKEMK